MISFFSFSQGRLVWSQAGLSQIAFLKVSFFNTVNCDFYWVILKSVQLQRNETGVPHQGGFAAVCSVPQQCEEPLAVPIKGTAGPGMGSQKCPWSVSWAGCSRSRSSGGSEAQQCAWKVPAHFSLSPILCSSHWALGGRQQLTVLGSLDVTRNCLHTSCSSWLGRRRAQVKGGADSWGSWQRHMVLYLFT